MASNADLEAMHENDAKSRGEQDAVPGGEHAHSPAHLGHVDAHTKPAGNLRDVEDKEEGQIPASRLEQGRPGR